MKQEPKMINFKDLKHTVDYIVESSEHNEHFGVAYETATAMYMHNLTHSRFNKDPAHQDRMSSVNQKGTDAFGKLPSHLQKRALDSAKASAEAYIESLKKNHGIEPTDIAEVHHTSKGIDNLVGGKTDRIQNPHDIVVKTASGEMHGASLKATKGTLSNNGIGTFDKESAAHGMNTDVSGIWSSGKKKAGLEGLSVADVKSQRDTPEIKKHNTDTQNAAATHHSVTFNAANLSTQKKHLSYLMKGEKPAISYDYVNGEKGSSTPQEDLPHIKAIRNAKKFTATTSGIGTLKIHDDKGNHIATVEHRPSHGAFSGLQVNAKIGTVK